MRYLLVTVTLLLVAACSSISARTPTCSREQAMKAETAASTLPDWDSVYRSFREFRGCDDGAIAEGYSESVSRLLAERWDDADKLIALTTKDPAFEAFVIRHVDETVPSDRLAQIVQNLQAHCPPGGETLCARLVKAAK